MVASIIIWALGYFPKDIEYIKDYDRLIKQTANKYDHQIESAVGNLSLQESELIKQKSYEIHKLQNLRLKEQQEKSYIGQLGHFISPILEPLGFDWKMSVSVLTGIAAKEVVVSTMGVLFQESSDVDINTKTLHNRLNTGSFNKGKKVFTSLSALSFLIFILVYFPCIAVIATIVREANWKWAAFVVFYTTTLAWLISFILYQGGSLIF